MAMFNKLFAVVLLMMISVSSGLCSMIYRQINHLYCFVFQLTNMVKKIINLMFVTVYTAGRNHFALITFQFFSIFVFAKVAFDLLFTSWCQHKLSRSLVKIANCVVPIKKQFCSLLKCSRLVECSKPLRFLIFIGGPKQCYVCAYTSYFPKQLQKCFGLTIPCTGDCLSLKFTYSNGTDVVIKGCDDYSTDRFCSNEADACQRLADKWKLKSCTCSCCKSDLCNEGAKHTPVKAFWVLFVIVLVFLYWTPVLNILSVPWLTIFGNFL